MSDRLVRALIRERTVRAVVAETTELSREAARRHDTSPVAGVALGQALTGVVLMGGLLKAEHRLAMKVEADGPLQKILAETDGHGHVRGYVARPQVPGVHPVTPEAVREAIGHGGELVVVKDLQMKHLYESVVSLQEGDLAATLTHYLEQSDQLPSLVEMDFQVDSADVLQGIGGVLLQTMPGEPPETLATLQERLDDLPPLGAFLAQEGTPEAFLDRLAGEWDWEILETRPVAFHCFCSRERSLAALRLLPPDELQTLIAEGQAVVDCHFCHERYVFSREELEALQAAREAGR